VLGAEEDLPHVFERFFREEEPLSARVSETGLRLMITKGVAELHGGQVMVESEEGLGTAFTVWLPLAGRD
jgi:signal transduction histidine kinase